MLKLKTLLTPIALSLALVLAVPAIAKKDRDHNPDDMRRVFSQLSLTDVQKQDIKEIMKQNRQDRNLLQGDNSSFRSELHTLVQSEGWNQSEIEHALTQHQTTISKKMLQQATQKNLVWNTLTSAQQEKLSALTSEKKTKYEHKKGDRKAKNGKHKQNKGMSRKLALTDAQKAEVKTIHKQAKEGHQDLKAKLKEFKQAERALIGSSNFSSDKWLALNDQYKSDFIAMAVSDAKVKHDIWNVLTVEQQQQLPEKIKKMKGHSKHKGKHREQKTE